nr:sulfatase-like hydrolase/transferase [uncultured Undibacterium sp.]
MNRQALKWLAKEFIFWFAIPLVFIFYFSIQQATSIHAVFEHLFLVALVCLFVVGIKFFLLEFLKNSKWLQFAFFLVYATFAFVLHLYYALVLVGLATWGKVVTIELIESYLGQIDMFLEASGHNYGLFCLILVLVFCGYFALVGKIFYQSQAVQFSFNKISTRYLASISLCGIFPILIFALNFQTNLSLEFREPFQQTLLLGKKNKSQALWAGVKKNESMNEVEEGARKNYLINENITNKNVILIVIDALRSDHLGVYGYRRNTTPYLNQLKAQGKLQVLSNTKASCGESACGLVSIASSRFVHQVPDNPMTLQSVLKMNGYKTFMILGGDHTNFYNLKELYGNVDYFVDGSQSQGYMNNDEFILRKLEDLKLDKDVPIFMQFHLMSAHTLGKRLERFSIFKPSKSYSGALSGATEERYVNHYDNGVLQSDSIIKDILDNLESRGILKNSLVVITADHGESLGEHNLYSHAHSAKEQLLSIPLMLINFSTMNQSKSSYHSQVDIAPTILREIKAEIPKSWVGVPLQDKGENTRPDFYYFQQRGEYGLYDFSEIGRVWKYRINSITHLESVFDLSNDREETRNLLKSTSLQRIEKWRSLIKTTIQD